MKRALTGRTALVTGSTQGVGAAIAVGLAEAGANVILHGLHDDESAQETRRSCESFGVATALVTEDLSQPTETSVAALFEKAQQALPDIDLLVNNAGSYQDVPFLEMTVDSFERTMRLNVASYFFLTQAFARHWVAEQVRGRVVMVGSINGRLAEATHSGYDCSKGAVEMMVRTLCVELAPHGIRVNGLAPGLFRTPLTAPALDDPSFMAWMEHHTPNGCVPGPEVAAGAAAFLLGDAAEHVHGHMLMVDGGMSVWQQPDP